MRTLVLLSGMAVLLSVAACHKSNNDTNHGQLKFSVSHKVDGATVVFDTITYTNAAGNNYGIEKLQYYISNICLYQKGKLCYSFPDIVYIDASIDSLCSFSITPSSGLKTGTYDSIALMVGIDAAHNTSNYLPASLANLDMGWPDAMGGGYHFFKMEGHWLDAGTSTGYAMHIGMNGFQINAGFPCSITVASSGDPALSFSMNVNKWFSGAYTYNFATDGYFSMGDSTMMKKLSTNGATAFYSN